MKFRKMACGCCRTAKAAESCKTPTYIVSNVADGSNLVFLLINKPGPTPCRSEIARSLGDRDSEIGSAAPYGYIDGDRRGGSRGDRVAPDIDACWRPTWRTAFNDDFEEPVSPILRNRRLLAEGSDFWPRRPNHDPDGALRDCE